MINVASDPAYEAIRKELEERLMQELTSTGDPRVQNDGKFYETAPMTGPLEDHPQAPRNRAKKP
jgi:N-sulfoglucosamine sulfohydrolase